MELKRVIGRQAYTQSSGEILRKRIAMIVQEKRIVTERRHRDADLRQVVQILKYGDLPEQQTVRNILRHHVSAHEMLNRSGFAAVRSQNERVQALLSVKKSLFTRQKCVMRDNLSIFETKTSEGQRTL